MGYRFLLFDLDGTLLDDERAIRPRTRDSLTALMAGGVGVGFATGRPPKSARPYVELLRPTGPLICFNGCLVWDLEEERCLHSAALEPEAAVRALRVARRHGAHANLYLGDEIYIEAESGTAAASARKDGLAQRPVGHLPEWLEARGEAPVKILFIHPAAAIAALERDVRAAVGERFVLVRSEPDYLELLPPGVNKGSALDVLCRARGVAPEEVIAFGDNLNDLELLERAGLGVALGNAHPRLREVADVVIGRHDTDAIATYLEGFALRDGRLAAGSSAGAAPGGHT